MFLLLQLAAHAQDTKYTVTLNVPENGTLSAYAGIKSGDYISRRSEFAAGEEVHLTGSLKAEYSSTGWTDEQGRQVCDSLHYIFTMPARNVVLTGHTTYDPANPPGPREDGYTDTWNRLYLRSNPEYGGAFTWGLGAESAQNWLVWTGYEFTVQAYPATGFKFMGWQLDGEIVSTDNPYTFIMPERDMTLYAMYDYDPETPANPHGNVWNKESGELIISEFVPGYLYNKVTDVTSRDPWHSDWDLIKSAIIDGPSTDESLTYDYPVDIRAITRDANNVEYLDYSRTSGITKVTTGCFSKRSLKQVVLPATITTIGEYAFYNCESLADVTCFATTPPTFEGKMPDDSGYDRNSYYVKWAFVDLNLDNIIVHVPAEAVPLYQQARGWKEFMILPITTGVQKLTVTLPSSGGTYKDMFLELVNTKTLQSQRYVITGATSYTFNNLIKNTQHCLYLKNQRGDVLGTIEGIDIQDKDLQVSFADLKQPIDIALRLTAPDGSPVEEGTFTATWTDRQGNYLSQGSTLPGQLSGTQVNCHVKLEEALGRLYLAPADTLHTVGENASVINHRLAPLPQMELSGTVTAESTGKAVRGATITVNQMLNGLYAVTHTAKTDIDGRWTLTAYDAPTTVTVSHSSYLKASLSPEALPQGGVVDIALKDINGTIVDLDLYYYATVPSGSPEGASEDYTDFDNIRYTVYDETHQQDLTATMSVQYPMIVLVDQHLEQGTRLRVTATSLNKGFMPASTTCSVDGSERAAASIRLTEMGKLHATFETTENMKVMGVLYDADGQLVGWATYDGTELSLAKLPDGQYTLVTMGNNTLFNAYTTYEALSYTGVLKNNAAVNKVNIVSGHTAEVSNESIPLFDEDGFRLTGSGTSFTANKSEVTVGQYVTLKAEVDFKAAYADMFDNIRLRFDLPEGCSLVEYSVMVGNSTVSNYYRDGQKVVVPLDHASGTEGNAVRFCVVPTQGGTHQVAASVQVFNSDGTTTQPIGSVVINAEDLTINVPATTGRRLLPVTGMAVPQSQVEIFDGGVSIGQTTALGTGYYSAMCPLDNPYNLTEHNLYAVVTTPEGMQMQSETKTVKINRGHLTPVVTMQCIGTTREHNYHQFVFDFRTNTVTPPGIKTSALGDFNLDFRIDFYDENDMLVNDTTAIKDVTLYVLYERRDTKSFPVKYNERHKCWYLQHETNYWNLPASVDLDYTITADAAADRQMIDDMMAETEAYLEESRREFLDVIHCFDDDVELEDKAERNELIQLLGIEEPDETQRQRIDELMRIVVGDSIVDAAKAAYAIDFSEVDAILNDPNHTAEQTEQAIVLLDSIVAEWEARIPARLTLEEINERMANLDALVADMQGDIRELRDSTLTMMTLLWLPDTTEHKNLLGDQEYILDHDGQYYHYVQRHLTSINKEQLLADGYIEMPITDGSSIYCLEDTAITSYIDTKTMMSYSLRILSEAEALSSNVRRLEPTTVEVKPVNIVMAFFPNHCISKFSAFVDQCGSFANSIKSLGGSTDLLSAAQNAIQVLAEMAKMVLAGTDGFYCLYENGRAKVVEFVENTFKKGLERVTAKLQRAELEKTNLENELAKENEFLDKSRERRSRLKATEKDIDEKIRTAANERDRQRWIDRKTEHQAKITELDKQRTEAYMNRDKLRDQLKPDSKVNKDIAKFKNNISKATTKKNQVIQQIKDNLPTKLKAQKRLNVKIGKFLSTPPIETLFKLIPLLSSVIDLTTDMLKWTSLLGECVGKLPCEGNPTECWNIIGDCFGKTLKHCGLGMINVAASGGSVALSAVKNAPNPALMVLAQLGSAVLDIFSQVYSSWQNNESEKDRSAVQARLNALKCDPDDDDDDSSGNDGTLDKDKDKDKDKGKGPAFKVKVTWPFPVLWFIRDPAGYVYEAVNSNRVEGVTATCYYKETKEDMYGDFHDEAVLWDAETYAQENPLFTDADGRYQWDVPTGLWQVKYEKPGYETTYSEWLPVPPPQLEVNVGITQMLQPNVQRVNAYAATNGSNVPAGVEVLFDKYMDPQTLTPDNISIAVGGQVLSGRIVLLNAEDGYQKPGVMYASKVRFEPDGTQASRLQTGQKVQLIVRRAVESYAGVPMEQDFSQQFDVEQRIEALVADSLLNIQEGKEQTLVVRAVPAAAAKGKKVTVTNSDDETARHSATELTLNADGEARLTLSALAQGSSVVRFSLTDNDELSATTLVTVRDSSQMQVAAPRASRLNGITLWQGSEIVLTCATQGATIFYTLNGVCPCDFGNKSIYTYDGPIILTGDSIHIKAMAVAPGMDDSPVVEYRFKGKARTVGIEQPTVPDASALGDTAPLLYFRLNGQRVTRPEKGITIVRQRNGRVRKVVSR